MPIERANTKPMAFDDMEAKEESPAAEKVESNDPDETATISLAMLGGQKVAPGDVVRLEVVDVSDEDGTATVKYATPKPGGISKAEAAFNEGP